MHVITVMQVLLFNTFTFAPYFLEGATCFPLILLLRIHTLQ